MPQLAGPINTSVCGSNQYPSWTNYARGGYRLSMGAKKGANRVLVNPLIFLEAATGFEPVNNGFADRSLATWVCRRLIECIMSPS